MDIFGNIPSWLWVLIGTGIASVIPNRAFYEFGNQTVGRLIVAFSVTKAQGTKAANFVAYLVNGIAFMFEGVADRIRGKNKYRDKVDGSLEK